MNEQHVEDLLREEYEALCRDAKVPSAGAVYWRASIRARSEAARKAEQPFTVVQGLTAASLLGVGAALGGFAWQSWSSWHSQIGVTTMFGLGIAALVVVRRPISKRVRANR